MQAAECQRFLFDDKTPWASPPGSCRFRPADAESAPQSALIFRFEIWCQAPSLGSRVLTENVFFEFSCSPLFDPLRHAARGGIWR